MRRLNITTLLAKIEATYGTDAVPTAAANAVLLRGKPTLTPLDMTVVQRDLLRPYLGNGDILPGSIFGKLSFEVEAAGSGAAGTAPPHGALLRACAVSQSINAAAVNGVAQAGGSTSTIKLAATASALDDFYTGLPIQITSGTGNGQSGVITDYSGATKIAAVSAKVWVAPDATSNYSIGAGVVYRPVSANFEAISLYFNLDGVLHQFLGARGNAVLDFSSQKVPFFKFDLEGIFQPVIDGATPAAILTAWKNPLVCTPANTPFFDFHENYTSQLETLSFDFGVALQRLELMNGTQQVHIDQRTPKFKVGMLADTMAARNWFTRCADGTTGDLALQHGSVAGNKILLSSKASRLSNPQYGAIGNVATLSMDGAVLPVSGNDEFSLCFC